MSDPSSEKHNVSRRDFIRLAGTIAGTGGLVAAGLWLKNKNINVAELQLMDTPEVFVGEDGEKLTQKIQEKIAPMFTNKENAQDFKDQTRILIEDIRRYAEAIAICKEEGFDLTIDHLNDIYYEKASFLQTMLNMTELYGIYSTDDMANMCGIENLTSVWAAGEEMSGTFENRKAAVEAILETPEAISNIPYYFVGDLRIIDTHIENGEKINPEWEGQKKERVKEVSIIGFNNDVAEKIKADLESMGLDRSLSQLDVEVIEKEKPEGVTTREFTSEQIFFIRTYLRWPSDKSLDLAGFEKYRKLIDHIISHEPMHGLSVKRFLLGDLKQRLMLRELELKILNRFDITRKLDELILPEGDRDGDGFFTSSAQINEYYTNWITDEFMNLTGQDDPGAGSLFSRFSRKVYEITGEDIEALINPDTNESGTTEEWLAYLKANKKNMGPFSSYFAQTIIDNSAAILGQHKWGGNVFYIYPRISALVFAHIISNKTELIKDLAYTKDLKNYIDATAKQMKITLTGFRGEEFVADVFSQVMMTKIYGESPLPKVNESFDDCEQILQIFKMEGLAREQLPQTV